MSHGGNKPYIEKKIDENTFFREFSIEINNDELAWHRDAENREIEVVDGKNWQFQYDNCLPVAIKPGDKITVEKNEWHRIIKGDTNLKLVIHK